MNMRLDHITDNHMHIDPLNGVGMEAAKRFKRAGGTTVFLVNKTCRDNGIELRDENSFRGVFKNTIRLKERIEEIGLRVFAVVGVHPAEFYRLCTMYDVERALEISKKAVDFAGKEVRRGDAVALGEIGRPHFPVEEGIMSASNELIQHSMTVAKDLDCAIQIHAESSSEELFKTMSDLAEKTELRKEGVVKHFCSPENPSNRYGLTASILSSKENFRRAIKGGADFLLESDYIDDTKRPGAVLGPRSVPRVTYKMIEEEVLDIDDAAKIHRDKVESVYGVELE